LEGLGLNLGYLLVQIFNFGILFIVLRAWVYYPILDLLEKRKKTIAQGLEDARIAAEARANAEKDAEKIIAKAQAEANEKIREATEKADTVKKKILQDAEEEAAKARENALAEVEEERKRILADVRHQVASLAIAAAQKLVGESLDEKRQHALIDEFFSGIKSGKVVVLEDADFKGASAEVISALPLTDEEKEVVRKEVISKLDCQTVTFRVDPAILGGLIIKAGDKVVDGSVLGQFSALRQTLV